MNMNKNKRLYILAANDRFNYGDLLFPYIIKHYFGHCFDDIKYISTTKSDLSDKGGVKTESFKSLYNIDNALENHLIVAGGDALCAEWVPILSYVLPGISYITRVSRKMSQRGFKADKITEKLIRLIFGTKTRFAFSIGKNELPQFKSIVYNSLGGSMIIETDVLKDIGTQRILSNVDYISVRDKYAGRSLDKVGIKNVIVPDSAVLMSEIFDEQLLLSHLSIPKDIIHEKYIFFQCAEYVWKDNFDSVISQLEAISEITKCTLCLCPIGTALRHSDQIALRQIAMKLRAKKLLIDNPNIYDIMWLIKHSQMYIGTSLHGTITAMSYGVQYIGYGAKKLHAYIDTWSVTANHFLDKENLLSAVMEYYGKEPLEAVWKEKVLCSFKEISKLYL